MPHNTFCGTTSIPYLVLWDTMENQRKFAYLNKETKEIIQEFVWKWQIHLSSSPNLRCAQNHSVDGYHSENWVQNKSRWTHTEYIKAVWWYDQHCYQQNYHWPIMTMKKCNFLQHSRKLIRNRMSESGLKPHSLNVTPTVAAKEWREHNKFALEYERSSGLLLVKCFLRRWNNDNGQILWIRAKIFLWATFPKSASPLVRRCARPSNEIMSVCLAARTTYAMKSNRRYIEFILLRCFKVSRCTHIIQQWISIKNSANQFLETQLFTYINKGFKIHSCNSRKAIHCSVTNMTWLRDSTEDFDKRRQSSAGTLLSIMSFLSCGEISQLIC